MSNFVERFGPWALVLEGWSPADAPQGAFRIDGTALPVPEPSTLLLVPLVRQIEGHRQTNRSNKTRQGK
jgi:hypothetical protein